MHLWHEPVAAIITRDEGADFYTLLALVPMMTPQHVQHVPHVTHDHGVQAFWLIDQPALSLEEQLTMRLAAVETWQMWVEERLAKLQQ